MKTHKYYSFGIKYLLFYEMIVNSESTFSLLNLFGKFKSLLMDAGPQYFF